MIFYILLVAVLNVGFGFTAAVYLGKRYRAAVAAAADPAATGAGFGPPADDAPADDPTRDDRDAGLQEPAPRQETPADEPPPAEPTETPPSDETPPEPELDQTPGKNPMEDLQAELGEYAEELTNLDDTFPTCVETPDAPDGLHEGRPDFDALAEDLQAAVEPSAARLDGAGDATRGFDDGDGPVEIHAASWSEGLAEISDEAGLEADLAEWWEQDPRRVRQLSVAMIDVDRFSQVNERYGQGVGDKILRVVAQLLAAEKRGESKLARLSGPRFLFLFPDADVRFTTNVVERLRQIIEMAHFYHQEYDIQITTSGAVTEATSEDTPQTLIRRAEATLQEAKRYGRNRTFLHEGKYPTPVVPPKFPLQEKRITL